MAFENSTFGCGVSGETSEEACIVHGSQARTAFRLLMQPRSRSGIRGEEGTTSPMVFIHSRRSVVVLSNPAFHRNCFLFGSLPSPCGLQTWLPWIIIEKYTDLSPVNHRRPADTLYLGSPVHGYFIWNVFCVLQSTEASPRIWCNPLTPSANC